MYIILFFHQHFIHSNLRTSIYLYLLIITTLQNSKYFTNIKKNGLPCMKICNILVGCGVQFRRNKFLTIFFLQVNKLRTKTQIVFLVFSSQKKK